jgi:hypothetical protein
MREALVDKECSEEVADHMPAMAVVFRAVGRGLFSTEKARLAVYASRQARRRIAGLVLS